MKPARPGLVILAVLMVVTFSALVALSIVSSGGTVRAHTDASSRRHEAEAMAWAGVQIALAELTEQRDDLLAGGEPSFTRRVELYQTAAGERAVVQLVAQETDDPFEPGERVFVALGGRVNLNAATEEMLAAIEGISETQASKILSERNRGPFATVAEALARCEIEDASVTTSLCTVSCESEVESGAAGVDRAGTQRIDVTRDAPALADVLDEILTPEVAEKIRAALDDSPLDSPGALMDLLVGQDVPQGEWGRVFDVACFSADPIAFGRVDLLRATEGVLASVPGIDSDAARSIVTTRDRLSDEERRTVTWPLTAGAMSVASFREALPWLTNRSMQYQIRVRAGFTPADSGESLSAAELRDAVQTDRLSSRVEWDVILDAAESPPRVSLIRDATSEGAWSLVAAERPDVAEPEDVGDAPSATIPPATGQPPDPDAPADATDSSEQQVSPRVGRWLKAGGDS
ncbi:MAG: helix-hairpin-helix domain-containing protein [Phycisphaerales bacterium]